MELFGTRDPTSDRFVPFHLYTMRQAIEEGFILDVLANYTTYDTYFRIEKAIRDDPEYEVPKARAAIARFLMLHPHNLAQKAEIIVEHFREHTRGKIGGKAKAMVVTSSRLHAVRYKLALDTYIHDKGYQDVHALVAFSGKVLDGGDEFTESNMNHFPESQTAREFGEGDYQPSPLSPVRAGWRQTRRRRAAQARSQRLWLIRFAWDNRSRMGEAVTCLQARAVDWPGDGGPATPPGDLAPRGCVPGVRIAARRSPSRHGRET